MLYHQPKGILRVAGHKSDQKNLVKMAWKYFQNSKFESLRYSEGP